MYNFERDDLKYGNAVDFVSKNPPVVIPIVNRTNNTLELYFSINRRYQYDTRKKVLLRQSDNYPSRVQYICAKNDVPQIFRDHYSRYLVNQQFLAGHAEGRDIEIKDGERFLEQECRRSLEVKEYETARSICDLAAVHPDNLVAKYYLGELYRFDTGGEIDYQISYKQTLVAAEAGFSPAYGSLASHYRFGKGVARDYKKALDWYIAAADSGHLDTALAIANMYMEGLGVETDYAQAAVWCLVSAWSGDWYAQNRIECMYANGVGVKQDLELANHWIRESCNKNSPIAAFNLAVLYEHGMIGNNDKIKAKSLFERAKRMGISKATDIIDTYDRV